MALQTKTWAVGDYAWGSWSNAYVLELALTEQSVSATDNTSLVGYALRLRSGSQNRFRCDVKSALTLAGQTIENTENVNLDYNMTYTLLSGTVTVEHNDDGSLTMPLEAAIYPNLSNPYAPPDMVISDTWSLTGIPRESTLSATAANIGEASTVVVSRGSDAFTHAIAVAFGAYTGWLTESGGLSATQTRFSKEVINFTLPESFYDQIPDAPDGVCTLTLTTYSGSTRIGAARTARFVATAAKSVCGPAASMTVTDTNAITAALTGDDTVLIRFCSDARCVLQASARKGASLVSATVAGQPVSLNGEGQAVVVLPGADVQTLTYTVTDSRGYSCSGQATAVVVPYERLTNNAVAARPGPTVNEAVLKLKGRVYTGSFGTAENTLTCRFRVETDGVLSDWQTVALTPADGSYSAEVTLTELDYQRAHLVHTEVTDAVSTAARTLTVHRGVPVFDWGQSDFAFHVPVSGSFLGPVGGAYIKSVPVYDGVRSFSVKTKFSAFDGAGDQRQTVLIMGSANYTPVLGMLTVNDKGVCSYSGAGNITAAPCDTSGGITVTLPAGSFDRFLLMSPELIEI